MRGLERSSSGERALIGGSNLKRTKCQQDGMTIIGPKNCPDSGMKATLTAVLKVVGAGRRARTTFDSEQVQASQLELLKVVAGGG